MLGVRVAITRYVDGAFPGFVQCRLTDARVKLNDKGEAVFTVAGKWGPEELSAAEGARRYLATEEGKFFLPQCKQGTGTVSSAAVPARAGARPSASRMARSTGALAKGMSLGALENSED